MKIFIRLLVLFCLVKECNAQENDHRFSLTVLGGGTKMSGLNFIGYGSAGLAWKINRNFSVGPTVHVMGFQNVDGIGVPITADITYTPFHGKVQPFANLQVGKVQYSHSIDLYFNFPDTRDTWKTTGGLFISPNVGVSIPVFEHVNFVATVGYFYTKFKSRYSETNANVREYHNKDFTDKALKASVGFSLSL